MPADEELLYGKIALRQGFCTPAQHAQILEIQKKILETSAPVPAVNKEGALFGKLVLKEKWLSVAPMPSSRSRCSRSRIPKRPPPGEHDGRKAPSAAPAGECDLRRLRAVFQGPIDSTGRIRCPSCNSALTPR